MNQNKDEFDQLALSAKIIKKEFSKPNPKWKNSPLEWCINLPSGTKGRLGKRLVSQWCTLNGFMVGKSPNSDSDITINNHRIEIKFSTLWKSGIYKFQQIRDQEYEYLICLGISPSSAHCWIFSKAVLKKYVIGHMGQHTGKKGSDTAWLEVDPNKPNKWLNKFGGSLKRALIILRKIR